MEWDIFKAKGLHLMLVYINSLIPKTDELGHVARLSNACYRNFGVKVRQIYY